VLEFSGVNPLYIDRAESVEDGEGRESAWKGRDGCFPVILGLVDNRTSSIPIEGGHIETIGEIDFNVDQV
jgi:hypothetical protein